MKMSIVGLGQCGCNITDRFYEVNQYASSLFGRRTDILTGAFAINTDEADLSGLKNIPKDKSHRILIGTMATYGHGVGKMNAEAAEIVRANNQFIPDTIMRSPQFYTCDAIMVIASGGGGTGSGIIGWIVKELKEKSAKPVYAVVVIPFLFEEKGQASYAIMNTATCISTVAKYADAVFLVDNESFRRAGNNLAQDLSEINREIAWNFFDLCCAGEEKSQSHVGSKVLDAGDIKRSLEGYTVIGRGQLDLPVFRFNKNSFREGIRGQSVVLDALRQSEGNTSLRVEVRDSRKMVVLITSPRDVITVNTIEEISSYLQGKSPDSIIRIGDYPRRSREVSVTMLASQLTRIPRLERIFVQAEEHFDNRRRIDETAEMEIGRLALLSSKLPRLD